LAKNNKNPAIHHHVYSISAKLLLKLQFFQKKYAKVFSFI